MIKRIISLLLIFSILVLLVPVKVDALELPGEVSYSTVDFWGSLDWIISFADDFDSFLDTAGWYDALDREISLYCPTADIETEGKYPYHYWTGGIRVRNQSCKYCGLAYSDYLTLIQSNYDDNVSDLDASTVNSNGLFTLYPNEWTLSEKVRKFLNQSDLENMQGGFSFSGYALDRAYFSGDVATTSALPLLPGVYRFVFDEAPDSTWVFHFYDLDSYVHRGSSLIFTVKEYQERTFTVSGSMDLYAGSLYELDISCHLECIELYDGSDYEAPDSSSRLAALTQALNDYNVNHPYQDSDTVINYYIGTTDDSGNVTDIYDPGLYDEETLIFTEPVTGAQYQTTGWTYDYTTRSYDITLDKGTFTIDGTDIARIYLVYGDDAVGITYYDASGLVAAYDTYSYVAVSASACTLDGHSYTVDTTKEASCTGPGERLYTCSVCGNQYVEEIAMLGHSYTFSIMKDATCVASGLGVYTCGTCGMQYTETIPSTEHTGVLIESVPTVYGDSGTVITIGYSVYECSTCGNQYMVYDEVPSSGSSSGFWDRLLDAFTDSLAALIESVFGFITFVLESILGLVTDLMSFFFGFLTETVLSGISSFFAVFTDGSLFEFFRQPNADGNIDIGLPDS